MGPKRDDGFAEYLAAVEPTIVIEHTRYCEEFQHNPPYDSTDEDYLHILISSAFPRDAANLKDWRDYLQSYPLQALTAEQIGTAQNPSVQVRAHFLRHALTRLLQLVNAPEVIITDLQMILDCHKPRAADLRAEAQAEWCADSEANLRAIARKQLRDHGQLYKDRDAGLLVKPSFDYEHTPMAKKKKPSA